MHILSSRIHFTFTAVEMGEKEGKTTAQFLRVNPFDERFKKVEACVFTERHLKVCVPEKLLILRHKTFLNKLVH